MPYRSRGARRAAFAVRARTCTRFAARGLPHFTCRACRTVPTAYALLLHTPPRTLLYRFYAHLPTLTPPRGCVYPVILPTRTLPPRTRILLVAALPHGLPLHVHRTFYATVLRALRAHGFARRASTHARRAWFVLHFARARDFCAFLRFAVTHFLYRALVFALFARSLLLLALLLLPLHSHRHTPPPRCSVATHTTTTTFYTTHAPPHARRRSFFHILHLVPCPAVPRPCPRPSPRVRPTPRPQTCYPGAPG